MTLRDRMIYCGIRTSRKMARLSWFQRDVFHGLILVADDFGRFEADAEMLRTVLFAPLIHKVTPRDVQGALVACHQAGLVKLYERDGRGYGEVINFRQKLKERRALYPPEDGPPPEPELFTEGLPTSRRPLKEGRKEAPHSPPPESGGVKTCSQGSQTNPSKAGAMPARFRRSDRLDTLHEEKRRLEDEMQEILRPGGCAYNVQPSGEKALRLAALRKAHAALRERIDQRRAEMTRETAA